MNAYYKKSIFCLIAVVATAFMLSCENDAVELGQNLKVKIVPATVLSNFTPYVPENFNMGDNDKLLITSLIYNQETGRLLDEKTTTLSDFASNYVYSVSLPRDAWYRIIVFSYCIEGDIENPEYESYTISGRENLNSLKITQLDQQSYYSTNSFLGYGNKLIDSSDNDITISLSPATALVYLRYGDIHSHDKQGVDKYLICYHNNDVMSFDKNADNPNFSTTLSTTSNNASSLTPSKNPDGVNIYDMINLLPGNSIAVFGRYFIGNSRYDFSNQNITLKAGHQYVLNVDCSKYVLSFYEGQLGTKSMITEPYSKMTYSKYCTYSPVIE